MHPARAPGLFTGLIVVILTVFELTHELLNVQSGDWGGVRFAGVGLQGYRAQLHFLTKNTDTAQTSAVLNFVESNISCQNFFRRIAKFEISPRS